MESVLADFRYAARRLRHSPGFTLVVVLTLALGIGANSAIFSVVNAVLLRPLPYKDPAQLVTVYPWYATNKLHAGISAPDFKTIRDDTHNFTGVGVSTDWQVNLTGKGEPERLRGSRVSAQFFPVLGVAPALGRTFRPDEDEVGREHEVVISDGLWKRLFGGSLGVTQQKVALNGEPYDIIGVMPAGFVDPWNRDIEVWTPIALDPALFAPQNFTNEFMQLVARLKPGMTLDQTSRDLAAFAGQLKQQYPNQFSPDWTLAALTMSEQKTGNIRPALLILLGAVGFVLLIACANVANLMLARAAARHKEVAIRTALGAGRLALVRQLLAESLLLSAIGGALGLSLAYGSVRALVAMNPGNIPGIQDLNIDGTVILFTGLVAGITGILFGLVPAVQISRSNLHARLKESGRSGTADRAGQMVRRSLVVAEVALALALLAGGGLLIKSFSRLSEVSPGFTTSNVLVFSVALPRTRYATDTAQKAFFAQLMPRLTQVPGVLAAGGTTTMPFGGDWSTGSFNVEGYTVPPNGNSPWGDIRVISPGFFGALQVPLVRGRTFDDRDHIDAPRTAVVDEEFVRRFYPPGTDVLGRRIFFGRNPPNEQTKFITIVGVVGHTKHEGLDADSRVQLYFSVAQARFGVNRMDIAVRTSGDPMRLVAPVRAAVREVDRDMPMANVRSMERMVENSLGQRRLSTVLLGVFAGLALLLASIGIYGVMSYTVAQRARELGVRIALGAPVESVLRLVLRQGMTLAMFGVAIGLAGAFALTRVMASQLFSVKPNDPQTFVVVTVVLGGVAFAATLVPALRATRVDPIIALREE
jgi:putative ABC transport system permease protein